MGEATNMSRILTLPSLRACRAVAGGLLLLIGAACSSGDSVGPSSAALPADSTAAPVDSIIPVDSTLAPTSDSTLPQAPLPPPTDSAGIEGIIVDRTSALPGIAFGNFNMSSSLISSVYTGTTQAVASTSGMLPVIVEVKAKGGRMMLKMSGGSLSWVKNADGTFSFTKWKAVVDKFRTTNLAPYIADGTIMAHYLVDEPNMAHRWGGKEIPQATIEAMAKYSKQIWPNLPTVVRVVPTWLAAAPVTYTYLDAGWAQYTAVKGNAATWIAAEVAAAKSKGLGLVASMNVLDGGNGSSGIRGYTSGKYSMSASEVRSYGTALLNQTYVCSYYNWMYSSTYFGRSDIKSAMAEMSVKARAHSKTSCRQ
jgi:hypothetical protein